MACKHCHPAWQHRTAPQSQALDIAVAVAYQQQDSCLTRGALCVGLLVAGLAVSQPSINEVLIPHNEEGID